MSRALPARSAASSLSSIADGTVEPSAFVVHASAIIRWSGRVPVGNVENAIMSGIDWFPTFVAAASNPNIVGELKRGKKFCDQTYEVHLDGYDQTGLITGKGPSKRQEVWYFTETLLAAARIDDFEYRSPISGGARRGGN